MIATPDPTTTYVRARLRELERIYAAGATIAGQAARGLVLLPYDEDPDIARRIALYKAWLARNAMREDDE
jgi:hypothetical protein